MNKMVKIIKLNSLNKFQSADIAGLLKQLNPRPKKLARCFNKVAAENSAYVAIHGGRIIGLALIHFYKTFSYKFGVINDVVVDENYRGRGIGKKLTEALITEAKKEKADCVDLTSNPKRIAAKAMYQKLGFKKRETNCYRLVL